LYGARDVTLLDRTRPNKRGGAPVNVTLDVFSALIDSRTGGSRVFDQIARRERWALRGQALYRAWDREHKRLQRECARWEPFAALGRQALVQVLDEHRLRGDVDAAMSELWASLADWPLWPDVDHGVRELARSHRVGLLSNIDDALLARTRLASLPFAPDLVITSQRVRQYKPNPGLYHAAHRIAAPLSCTSPPPPATSAAPCRPMSTPSASSGPATTSTPPGRLPREGPPAGGVAAGRCGGHPPRVRSLGRLFG